MDEQTHATVALLGDDGLESSAPVPTAEQKSVSLDEIVGDAIRRFRDQAHVYRQLCATELGKHGPVSREASVYLYVAERSMKHAIALLRMYDGYLNREASGGPAIDPAA